MKDFFISYNHADRLWAQGIGDWLDQEGFSTVLQSNDFVPGTNFVAEMHEALQTTKHLILVLSPDYLNAKFPEAEWTAAFAVDPTNSRPALIPVRVRECSPAGLLKPLVYIDLVGLNVDAAKTKFTAEIQAAIKKQRNRTPSNPALSSEARRSQDENPTIKQTARGQNITQIAGNQINYHKPPVQKNFIVPRAGAVSPAQRRQIQALIKELAESTVSMGIGESFKMWWERLKRRFDVEKYEEILASDMPAVEAWGKQQRAINVREWKHKAPDAYRSERYKAIKASMRSMGVEKESYYPELAGRLKMKPFSSLTQLTKVNLDRVYNMVLRDARR